MFGPKSLEQSFVEGLRKAMVSPYFPVNLEDLQSVRIIRAVKPNEVIVFHKDQTVPEVFNKVREQDLYRDAPLKIWIAQSYGHPDGGVYTYRIEYQGKSVVYATDTEGYVGGDVRLIQFARNADILIHDSQYMVEDYESVDYPVQGFGHSTYAMAAEVARAAQVKKLFLFHFDPQYTDDHIDEMIRKAREIFPETEGAQEGLIVDI